jgi:hypothetical protein
MPITSYLAHPVEGQQQKLLDEFLSIPHCEALPAMNTELLILITDTGNAGEEASLKIQLESLENLKHLAMVAGFQTPRNS